MGNSQTTTNEAIFTFFTTFGGIFALGAAIALHAHLAVHRHWFRWSWSRKRHNNNSSTSPEDRYGQESGAKPSWYARLHKPPLFPGTWAYIVFFSLLYFFQAYTLWRVWINVPAQQYSYGIAFLWLVLGYLLSNAVASALLFGVHDLIWALLAYVLAFGFSGVALVMLGLLTWYHSLALLPSATVFVLQCLPTAGSLILVILVALLLVKNPRHGRPLQRRAAAAAMDAEYSSVAMVASESESVQDFYTTQ